MKKADIDPLTKGSFEKTIEILLTSAVFCDSDRLRGVSSRLHIGSVFRGGTGYCGLAINKDMIQNSAYTEQAVKGGGVTSTINSIANAIMKESEEGAYEEGEDIFIPE